MPDVNYCPVFGAQDFGTSSFPNTSGSINSAPTVNNIRVACERGNNVAADISAIFVGIFR